MDVAQSFDARAVTALTETRIQAGDAVLHAPTGEEWFILGVRGDRVCVAGWPATIATLADCTLVKKGDGLTDDQRSYRTQRFGDGWS